MSIFKACDIRGVVGEGLDEGVAGRIGQGLARMIRARGGGPVCIGGDFRRSTPRLKQALVDGLLGGSAAESPIAIYDVGQAPTPVVYYASSHLG